MNHLQRWLKSTRRSPTLRRGGFTLIEIMVVLAIATFVAAIVIGGFSEMTAGSKRTSCQTNLTQIYQAARLYAADEGGSFPFYDPDSKVRGGRNIGLWNLYTFPRQSNPPLPEDPDIIAPVDSKPNERYLRSAKSLHCPNDYDTNFRQSENLYTDPTKTEYNRRFLSYQGTDFAENVDERTYSPIRNYGRNIPNPDFDWNRQLLFFDEPSHSKGALYDRNKQVRRFPDDKTVVTWCRFHRGGSGRSDIDPVLFYDGTVQLIPVEQEDPDNPGTFLVGSQRKPKATP